MSAHADGPGHHNPWPLVLDRDRGHHAASPAALVLYGAVGMLLALAVAVVLLTALS